ncbi:MAG: bifunctional (p)ppGpp synthetase/guanosine-3',5'-bis(diphosphate) 3'-pyrophosphohydrolase [Chloroflexi bacterium]|nr:bifunctional (p)ppGpp synthetase/guanosine-3',5'-bis(diphosphate) 3'-pyrophosphohydrolase [Chloroflexota bacterium]
MPVTIEEVVRELRRHYPEAETEPVTRAHEFAAAAHEGQKRATGGPYIEHPNAVALLLAELGMDPPTILAAFLHDVPEDTARTNDEIRREFGDEVAGLVEGVTKLSRVTGATRDERQAENLRKMFLAMADDLRVVVIKLCDRLHNMRTIEALAVEAQQRIARETVEIYAPLAHRLGIGEIKWELEDLAFKVLEPDQYRELAEQLAARRQARERYVGNAMKTLAAELERAGIGADLSGRAKHLWSIAEKMRRKQIDFEHVYDLLAIRVMVQDIPACYTALGVVHALWPPIPGQFDDYIAMPKPNLYRSLHTAVIGPDGKPLEIQIRTQEMHALAEYGVAAHWRYKEGGKTDPQYEQKLAWIRQLMEWQHDVSDTEFVESLKVEVFHDQVFVFTPKGEVKDLPAGSTPIDFAYRIHTDIGHRCIGAKVSGRLVPLNHRLESGDIVEIVTSRAARGPSRDWLSIVRTASAREKIRGWFKRAEREENIVHGREVLDRELRRIAQRSLADVPEDDLRRVAASLNQPDLGTLYASLGFGAITPPQVVTRLGIRDDRELAIPEVAPPAPPPTARGGVRVKGVEDLLVRMAICCNPVPGDAILGYITRGRGVTVHRTDCPNIRASGETERMVEVEWDRSGTARTYPVAVRIQGWDRPGFLRDVAAVISEAQVQILSLAATANPDHSATVSATLQVTSIDQLSRVLARIEGVRDVLSVSRDGH